MALFPKSVNGVFTLSVQLKGCRHFIKATPQVIFENQVMQGKDRSQQPENRCEGERTTQIPGLIYLLTAYLLFLPV